MARMRRAGPWWWEAKRCWYYTMDDGKQVNLGVHDPKDVGGAWAAVHALLAEIKGAVVRPGVRPGTVAELAPGYLAEAAARVKPDTLRQYTAQLRWLVNRFGDQAAGAVEVAAVVAAAGREATWGDTHRANHLTTAGAFLRWCGRAERVPAPAKPSRGAEAVIPDKVYADCLHHAAGDFRAFLKTLWLTGCRPGEGSGLTAEAVDWEAGTARVKAHKTRHRTGRDRLIFLGSEALLVLACQRDRYGTGLLFRGVKGRRYTLQSLTMRFQRLSEKVGHKVTSYQFRHTFATRALLAGVPDVEVAALLGHTSTAMVSRTYGHVNQAAQRLREAAERAAGKRAG